MNDLESELYYYRDLCNDLGRRILRLQRENTQARRESRQSRLLTKLIGEAHKQTNPISLMDEIGLKFLQIILSTLSVDRAAILEYVREQDCFTFTYSLGFETDVRKSFSFPQLPDKYYFISSKSTTDPLANSFRQLAMVPYLLWAFNPDIGVALLFGNKTEDQRLHLPFEENDREIVEGALNVFIDIKERKVMEEGLFRRDAILEAVDFAAERFMLDSSWESSIEIILKRLGLATQVNRVSLFQIHSKQKGLVFSDICYEWMEQGSSTSQNNPTPPEALLTLVGFPRWKEMLRQGRTLKGNTADFPKKEQEILVALSIRSIMAVPVFSGGEWWGLMAFCDHLSSREWSPTETEALKLVAGTLGALIQRNKIEDSLRESEAKYRLIAENITDIVYTMDLNLMPTYISPSIKPILGYTVEEAMTLSLFKIMTPQSYEKAKNGIEQLFFQNSTIIRDTSKAVTMEIELIKKNGSTVFCEGTNLPLYDNEDRVIGFIGVTRDISERKKGEAELIRAKETAEEASRAKSLFLANMSHELRTPLNHIIGFTELVVDKNIGDLNETQQEYLTDVLQSSKHLLSLINDILDLSKVEAGRLELVSTDVNLKILLENSLTMIKEKSMKHGIKISVNVDGVPEKIRAEERKLKQIMYNLLSNAVKFTPYGGEISLEADLADGSQLKTDNFIGNNPHINFKDMSPDRIASQKFVQITVTDSGIGINPENLYRIFNPFEQVENSASRKYQGTGLGLSLTKNLVEVHGGIIWAESNGLGKGSSFIFIIPV